MPSAAALIPVTAPWSIVVSPRLIPVASPWSIVVGPRPQIAGDLSPTVGPGAPVVVNGLVKHLVHAGFDLGAHQQLHVLVGDLLALAHRGRAEPFAASSLHAHLQSTGAYNQGVIA